MSENRVIGKNGQLPWNIPEDFQWVKEATMGKVIAMGRRTFESMGRPLPGRHNLILSKTIGEIPGCTVLPDLNALESFQTDKEVWIFGGSGVYEKAMDRIQTLYLTLVFGNFEGDTHFPEFESRFHLHSVLRKHPQFEIRRYENLSAPVPQSAARELP